MKQPVPIQNKPANGSSSAGLDAGLATLVVVDPRPNISSSSLPLDFAAPPVKPSAPAAAGCGDAIDGAPGVRLLALPPIGGGGRSGGGAPLLSAVDAARSGVRYLPNMASGDDW